jgi:hypothetical protein
MSWRALLFATVISVSLGVCAPVHAQTRARESIIVRSYDTFGVAAGALRAAAGDVVRTYGAAGIEVQWKACAMRRGASLPAACADTLAPREVVMRIVAAPRAERNPDALGFSYVDAGARRGTLGTVYMDRVTALAHRLRAEPGQMLGRAIAHELAHLLLGTPAHSTEGVMRERWLHDDNDAAAWIFSARDASDLRAALAAWPSAVREVATVPPQIVAPHR